ncbi:Signal transduction histidine-protein kinase BarA [Sporomusa ovata DSM 2662]|uniref:Circadian input-output histidine kinase CikA n=1 Tax=Sporomusa ovata TaxID=2378 RepID=A0A0U1KUB9_9FIRM|nr:transporter substrate-binding domain-containing protein [Sporomusa ovata]EQB26936.1 sensor protein GacS [Sporomusa ovata DSM 2662]CQR71038.1 Sensory box histidine kinase/response regulator [Sporomusa ovata]
MKLLRNIFLSIVVLPFFITSCFAAQKDIQFTQLEKDFIKEHPVIHLGVDPQFIPYEFIDTDGVYKGIAADYIKLISARTGLEFVVEKNLSWPEAYEKGVVRLLDAFPCVSKTKEREQYFLYSEPYYSFQRVIYINENNNTIKNFADVMNRKVAVQTNSSHHSYLKAFESIKPSPYFKVEEALRAVADGREEAFIGNLATSNFLIKANGITNLKYVEVASEEKQSLYFAVRKDWPILVSILNKALADITQEEKINIDNRWLGVEKRIDYTQIIRIVGIVGIVLTIIFLVSLYWIVKLRKEVETRKRIEAALKVAKEEAEYANHVKSTFLARMSHEIRTPLNAITGMAYVIKKTDVTTIQKIYLEKITRAARDMLGIINDILDFSKIEAGKIDIERISFNLDDILEQLISIVSFKIDEQNIDFSMNRDPEIPTFFWGDQKRIQQVLLNIVNNAVKFTKDGAVSLTIRLVAKVKDSYKIEFSVKDTGIGMSNEQLEQLFAPFSQGDSSISRRFGGTGLGLSIVKSLVEQMGGSIEVYSAVDEGSTFNIQLTLEVDRNKDYEEKKKAASVYFQNIRVLVVEKNAFYRNLLSGYLHSFNMVAEFATSEARALELMEKVSREDGTSYNLLIVDYETPQDGGIAFCTKVKRLPWFKEVPKFIVMIPLSKEELFKNLEEAGLDFGITKPIIPSILYNGIVEIFRINVIEMHESSALITTQKPFKVEYPYHVLIIEDNKTNQFIAQSILEQSGFRVTLADDGVEGYELFLKMQQDFDLILMDIHMPVMSGYEATSLIRNVDRNIPIIAMTADAIAGVEEKCKSTGIDHYISKPFDPEQFIETIWQVVKPYKEGLLIKSGGEAKQEDPVKVIEGVLDEKDGISHMGGNADLYELVLKEYYNENLEISSILCRAIEKENYEEAAQIVHKIKSSSGSIGAKGLYKVASNLQRALGDGEIEIIPKLHKEFDKILKQLLSAIAKRINLHVRD